MIDILGSAKLWVSFLGLPFPTRPELKLWKLKAIFPEFPEICVLSNSELFLVSYLYFKFSISSISF